MTSVIKQMIATAKWVQFGAVASAALVGLNPGSLNSSDFRSITRTMVVEINRASPAYGALEDVRYNYGFEKTSKVSRVVLPAIKLESLSAGSAEPILVAKGDVTVSRVAAAAEEPIRQLRGVSVSIEDDIFPAQTVAEAAEVLVQEELRRRSNDTEYKKHIETKYGSPIVVARIDKPAEPVVVGAGYTVASSPRNLFAPSREVKLPSNYKPSPVARTIASNDYKPRAVSFADIKNAGGPELPTVRGFTDKTPNIKAFTSAANDPLDIRGNVRITGGLAYAPGQDSLEIYQEIDGAHVRQGEFHLSRGYFRIQVENLKGRLVAEIRNRDGEMIGRGELLVADIAADRIQEKESVLKIAPLFDGLIGKVVAGATSFKTLPAVEGSRLTVQGLNREIVMERQSEQYIDKQIRPGSRVLMRAQAPGHWGSIFFGEAGVPFEGRLFSNKIIGSLLDLTSTNKFTVRDNEEKGIIWGRILVDGKPLAGAKVELPFAERGKVTYFSGFLPDVNLATTSNNGEFVVTGIDHELQIIKVSANGKTYTPIFTEAAPRHVSAVDFEVQAERDVQMAAFEAFTEEDRPALLQIMGEEKHHELQPGGVTEKLQLTRGLALAEVEGGELYRLSRVMLNGYESEITAPLFKQEWANAFGTNLVVGQIEGDDFQVFVGTEGVSAELQVSYIDNHGQRTEKKFGEAGGGFVVRGLPEGLHTITIMPVKNKKAVTQLVYVDDQAIHFFKKSLF